MKLNIMNKAITKYFISYCNWEVLLIFNFFSIFTWIYANLEIWVIPADKFDFDAIV